MDPIYPRFAVTDPAFYDDPRRRARSGPGYRVDDASDWTDWELTDDGHWAQWSPVGATLPAYGWKIHVGTTLPAAADLLRTVSRHCRSRGVAFKHLSHPDVLLAVDGKDGDRTASGKFVTIYPRDEEALHALLLELDALLEGAAAPHVLTDLRWNAGPLSVRYGAFVREMVDEDGTPVAAVRRPDGTLVPDVRDTAFHVPDWVSVPPFLAAQLAALSDLTPPPGFPHVEQALHHSNAGGVYSATDHDGSPVVLKEARAHVGLTPDGRDAVARLGDEARVLTALRSARVTGLRRVFDAHGHRFLVLDRAEGVALQKALVLRHPLVRADATRLDRATYRDWAVTVTDRLDATLREVHAAGYSHGDLHPGNVIVDADDDVVLLDFEMARSLSDDAPAIIGAPGFVAPDGRGGARLDRYALACIRLFLFAPLTPLIALDARKADDLLDWIGERFGTDAAWAARVRADLALPPPAHATPRADAIIDDWHDQRSTALDGVIDAIAGALVDDLDTSRDDRAWPGDPAQFALPSISLAHGATGPLVALHATRTPIPDALEDWYAHALTRDLAEPARPGLYDGLAGALWAQRYLGRHADADRVLDHLRDAPLDGLGVDLFGGLSGIGLALLAEADGDLSLMPRVREIAARVRDGFARRPVRTGATTATGRAGLLRGGAGVALFALRYSAMTGDDSFLALAEDAIDDDLAVATIVPDGSLQIDEGWRTTPHFGTGSAGVGVVLGELIGRIARPERFAPAFDAVRRASCAELIVQPGLFEGRAGLIHALLSLARTGRSTADTDAALARHLDSLRLHAIRRPSGLGFPGQALLRLSCDFATGSAGVLTALSSYRDLLSGTRAPVIPVPFLTSPTDAPPAAAVLGLARL